LAIDCSSRARRRGASYTQGLAGVPGRWNAELVGPIGSFWAIRFSYRFFSSSSVLGIKLNFKENRNEQPMSEKKVITVIGATGAQGGGLVRAILQRGKDQFVARAVTRKPNDEKAKALKDLGVQVVQADLDDVNSLKEAFKDSWGAFCVTNFWEHVSPEKELNQAKNMADAARSAKVKHVIWSTLEDSRKFIPLSDDRMPTLMGKYKVPHFDAKGEANEIFMKADVPTTLFHTSFYWDNLIHFGMNPKPDASGKLVLTMPLGNQKFPGIAVSDIGKCALGVFMRGSEFLGKSIGVAGEHLTGAEMAQGLSKALGKEVHYNAITPAQYRSFGFPGADDLANMFQFNVDFAAEFCKARSVEFSRSLNPELQSFAMWAEANRNRIPLQ